VWSPAFVSFIGFGPHVGFGFGFGTIGWFPVGPFDPFFPWWGVGFNRFTVVNINFFNRGFGFHDHDRFFHDRDFRGRGFSNFNLAINNPRVRAGITTVSAENFGRGNARFEHGVDEATLRSARVAQGNLGVVPTRESLSARGFASAPAGMRNGASTHFFTRTQAAATMPSFHEQTARMQEAIRTHAGGVQGNTRFSGEAATNGRFGRSDVGTTARGSATQNGAADRHAGWSTFSGGQGQRGQETTGRSGNDTSRYGSHTFGGSNSGSNPGGNRDYRSFNEPRGSQGNGNGNGRGEFSGSGSAGSFPQNRSSEGGRWQPPSNSPSNFRPRLDLSKPIVVPRGETSARNSYNGGNSSRGYSSAPYNGNSGSYNRGYSGGAYNGGSRGYSSYTGSRGGSYSGGGRSSGGGSGSRGSSGHSSSGHSGGNHGGGHR